MTWCGVLYCVAMCCAVVYLYAVRDYSLLTHLVGIGPVTVLGEWRPDEFLV